MKHIKIIGIDIAKNVFQLYAVTERGKKVFNKRMSRNELSLFVAQQPQDAVIVMEACATSHYWARKFKDLGFEVKLISPQFVKPFIQGNKNDSNDARAIVAAYLSPEMRFVPPKTLKQQDLQSLHRARSLFMKQRNAYANQIRGLLAEYGVIIPQGVGAIKSQIPGILEDADNELTGLIREIVHDVYEQFKAADKQVELYKAKIAQQAKSYEPCALLMKLPGVGPLIATAMVSAVGKGREFQRGREMSAWLGLTPRHQASGHKKTLQGISKRGDSYLRTLVIHGARSVLHHSQKKDDARNRWAQDKKDHLGKNKAAVALANKTVREMWAALQKGEHFVCSQS